MAANSVFSGLFLLIYSLYNPPFLSSKIQSLTRRSELFSSTPSEASGVTGSTREVSAMYRTHCEVPPMCIWTPGHVSAVTSSLPHQPLQLLAASKVKRCTDKTRLRLSAAEEKPKLHCSAAASRNLFRQISIPRPLPTSVQKNRYESTDQKTSKESKKI